MAPIVPAVAETIVEEPSRAEEPMPVAALTDASFESERVREFSPPEPSAPAPSAAPGYEPVAPVVMSWPSDLQQVESDPQKVREAQSEPVEAAAQPRPKRVRQPLPPVSEEPLVQIETARESESAVPDAGEKSPESALPR